MEIIVAKSAGFCFGVKNAVDEAYKNIGKKVVTYGPIIHNKYVIEDLKKNGIEVIEDLKEVNDSTVLIRSHGVNPKVYEYMDKNNINYIDCTCPYVKKIHRCVEKKFKEGYKIIIIGDKNHPEIIGINGYTNNSSLIFKDKYEIDNVEFDKNQKYAIVVQTTFRKLVFDEIIYKIKLKVDNIEIFNTICNATSERQKEAEEISKIVDIMIVLGDLKSSNTSKLYEISKKNCKNTFLYESVDEIELNKFTSNVKIGITAGASTPSAIIKEAINKMSEIANTKDNQTFEEMLNESMITLHMGSVVKGKIIQILNGEIIVDLGYKSDGVIPKNELLDEKGNNISNLYRVGDEIEVYVLKINDGEGNVLLSIKKLEEEKGLSEIEKAFIEGNTVKGIIKGAVKGGLITIINGVRVFVPSSHISHKFIEDISQFKNKEYEFKIIEFDKLKRKIVASRKELSKEEERKLKIETIEKLEVSDCVEGIVSNITSFGAFVNIGSIDGLIHISELSWKRIDDISKIIKVGEKIKVKILDIDRENLKVSLSLKQINYNPWENICKKYYINDIVEGKVVKLVDFGAFVELEDGVDGLIHISQISNSHIKNLEKIIKIGEKIKVKIIGIDKDNRKLSLSKKDVDNMVTEVHEPNPEIPNSHWERTIVEKVVDEIPNREITSEVKKHEKIEE